MFDGISFYRSLSVCVPVFLEILVGSVGDDYGNVASAAQAALANYRDGHQGDNENTLVEILEENLYTLATQLPRLVRTLGESCIWSVFICWAYSKRHKNMLAFPIDHFLVLDYAGCWNPSLGKASITLFCIHNIMAADNVVIQGARASAAMVLTSLYQIIPVSAPENYCEESNIKP